MLALFVAFFTIIHTFLSIFGLFLPFFTLFIGVMLKKGQKRDKMWKKMLKKVCIIVKNAANSASTCFKPFWIANFTRWRRFLEKWQKPHLWAIFYVFWPKWRKLRKISKIRLDRFFSLKCPLFRAKFSKNCSSGFRETAVTDGRTDGRRNERTEAIL